MQNIQSIAHRIKSDIVAQARQVGCTPQEIAALEEDDFFEDTEAAIRVELAALRFNHRRAIRAATPRKPATRREPRRAVKEKASTAGGGGDGDGPGPWSIEAIDNFYSFKALPILSPTFRTTCGEFVKYRGATVLGPVPRVACSIVKIGEPSTRAVTLSWVDAATGCFGFGVVALVAHVLRISETAASDRLARFAANVQAARGARGSAEVALEQFKVGFVFPFGRRAA